MIDVRNNNLDLAPHRLYLEKKYLCKHISDGTKISPLVANTQYTMIFLDIKLLADMYFTRIAEDGELG
jgi:hypothetical protein